MVKVFSTPASRCMTVRMAFETKAPLAAMAMAVTLAFSLLIAFLTLGPSVPTPAVPGADKTYHFAAFFALSLPLAFARPRLAPWIVAAAIAYGGVIEILQPFVGRSRDALDFFADVAGSLAGSAVGTGLAWLRHRIA